MFATNLDWYATLLVREERLEPFPDDKLRPVQRSYQ